MRRLPSARGPISEFLLGALVSGPHALAAASLPDSANPLGDGDLHLALYLCYELHYRGLPGVDERWEWEPGLLRWRATLEQAFERALRASVPVPAPPADPADMDVALRAIADADDGPSLSRFVETRATVE